MTFRGVFGYGLDGRRILGGKPLGGAHPKRGGQKTTRHYGQPCHVQSALQPSTSSLALFSQPCRIALWDSWGKGDLPLDRHSTV